MMCMKEIGKCSFSGLPIRKCNAYAYYNGSIINIIYKTFIMKCYYGNTNETHITTLVSQEFIRINTDEARKYLKEDK